MLQRLTIAGVALGLILCAFLAGTLAEPARFLLLALAGGLAAVLAATFLPRPVEGRSIPEPSSAPGEASSAPLTLDAVIAALPVGVIIVGDDGRISAFNQAAGEIFDVAVERARGRALIEAVRSFELDRRLTSTLREGTEEMAQITYTGAQERYLHVSTAALPEIDGRRSALAVVMDQTRVRELESLRRDFVSNVSHELRTPLTAVKLMVETLQSGVDAAAAQEFLTSISGETERMITLVEDLLDLARLETGKLELRLGTVDVAALCREAVAKQAQRARSLGLTLEARTPEEPLVVTADRDKLYQVLVNLLDNALRHTAAGGTVRVAAERLNNHVDVTVQDTGTGIPSTSLPHIFERFYVVDAARARNRSGTGLGLAIVKHIIEAHGGSIGVESELGVGTLFRCSLRS